jgi:hypothetical protein
MIAAMRPGPTPTSPASHAPPRRASLHCPLALCAGGRAALPPRGAGRGSDRPAPVAEAARLLARRARARPRLVSLNPSLTAIVARLGAAQALVGIDDYSARVEPELADRPRVGGLFDPSLEAVMALRPDRVLIVAGLEQESHGAAFRRLGLAVEVFENERYEQVLANIERIGRLVGRETRAAEDRITAIRALRAAVERAVAGRPRPRTVIVLDRSPLYLVGRRDLPRRAPAGGRRDEPRGRGRPRLSAGLPRVARRGGARARARPLAPGRGGRRRARAPSPSGRAGRACRR